MKITLVILLFLVVLSLFSGLYFMYRDKGQSRRTVIALTIRVALSVTIFLIVIAGYFMGWIREVAAKVLPNKKGRTIRAAFFTINSGSL